ncbi:MAG: peptidoglycan DD-metalloendopeptidase family protein [Chloroflexi bacterium]|nr:peptidoglycan DD-metalloendopeptidase family protein [Chloroflexota bacterium]
MRSFGYRFFITLSALLIAVAPVRAQGQCGTVTSIGFPVDVTQFRLVQDYGVPSPRHQGRYHTGEDYYGGRGSSYGQPVRAIAAGRVTYSAPLGWGRDGGVVIIEHTFPDGSIAYSQYGHMEERPETPFPARYGCVKMGDVVGSVGNARPAPHLHFEIRTNQPDVPGPGYTWDFPDQLGWVKPTPFVTNWSAWLQASHRWHTSLSADWRIPPVELDDHSLVYLDSNRLRRLTPDGRLLWRVNFDRQAVGVFAYENAAAVAFADGTMQPFGLDGTPGEAWTTNVPLQQQVLVTGDTLMFQTPDNVLVAFGADRTTPAWRLDGMPPIVDAFAAPKVWAFLSAGHRLFSVSPDGRLLDTATLRAPASFAAARDGALLAYSQGGLWRVGADGVWSLVKDDAPPGGADSGVLVADDGTLYVVSRDRPCRVPTCPSTLTAYDHNGGLRWQADLPGMSGQAQVQKMDDKLLLVSTGGNILTLKDTDGATCNAMRIYGGVRVWDSLGADGVLRLAIGTQMMGLDWQTLSGDCG